MHERLPGLNDRDEPKEKPRAARRPAVAYRPSGKGMSALIRPRRLPFRRNSIRA